MRVREELLLSSKCCKDLIASPEILKNFTSDKVYAVCSTHSSGEDSNNMNLELFVWCEYEKYITIRLAFFSSWFFLVLLGFTFKCRCGNPGDICECSDAYMDVSHRTHLFSASAYLRKAPIVFIMSVRLSAYFSAATAGRNCVKGLHKNLPRNSKIS